MNSMIHSTLDKTSPYHHKKFDQLKHVSRNSMNLPSSGHDSTEEENVGLKESIETPTNSNDLSDYHPQYLGHKSSRTETTTFENQLKPVTQNVRLKKSIETPTNSNDSSDYYPQNFSHKRSRTETITFEKQLKPVTKKKRNNAENGTSCSESFSPVPPQHLRLTPIPETLIPPPADVLPEISPETLETIYKFHDNMVRKFPEKQRTPKEQQRRYKNTIACRVSRRIKKLEQVAIEEQYKEFKNKTFSVIEHSMRATVYLHELMKLLTIQTDKSKVIETQIASTSQQKKPFTIECLLGNEP